jgi:hypothetical protein
MYSFDSLHEKPKQGISFEKPNTYMNNDKHTVLLKRNKTLANLRMLISKEYEMSFAAIGLSIADHPELDFSHS